MSHYSVLVLSREFLDDDGLAKVMAPFDENMRVPKYIRYTKEELIKEKREEIENYKNTIYAEYLKDPEAYREKNKGNPQHVEYVEKIFPKKLIYTDEECYKEAIEYYEPEEIDERGGVISEYNPKSKWDWYQVGGRFGTLARDKETGDMVCEGFGKELDFEEDKEAYDDAIRFWELIVEGATPITEEDNEIVNGFHFVKDYYVTRYGTKEWYAKCCANFFSYAVVTPEGEWLEPGQMGWFGVSHASPEDELKWHKEYDKLLTDAIENNYYMILVDCHI